MPTTYRRLPPATRSPNVASTSSDAGVSRANTCRKVRLLGVNTLSSPDLVVPKKLDDPKLDGGRLQAVLPPLSWNMIRLS